ncbi:transglutaminase-like cysteine peptidase [Aquisediminimonas sediminicola]|uniref:transglutaminase-like cysteine peptidase n=1 Tax=Alteraquisediminimonas sediminicola TaxID=2676787 RepID=UPI001C8E6B2E|nr:transglutaminase-like cysteine peptidase [Aquisediminimonas sediminicola]
MRNTLLRSAPISAAFGVACMIALPVSAQEIVADAPQLAAPNDAAPIEVVPTCAPSDAPLPAIAPPTDTIETLPQSGLTISLPPEMASPETPVAPCAPPPPPPPVRPPAPNVFGSVALPVGSTALDARWQEVRAQALGEDDAPWRAIIERAGQQDLSDQIWMVNDWVNHNVAFTEDRSQDVWSAAGQTIRSGQGDCEDYAIAKMALLRRLGVSEDDLFLVIVRDLFRKADHAVLAVRRGEGMLVLDSRTDKILRSDNIPEYRPTIAYSGSFAWTYGYRVGRADAPMPGSGL